MRRLRVVVAGLLERGSAIAFGDGVAQTLLVDDALAPGLEAVERRGVEVRGSVPRVRFPEIAAVGPRPRPWTSYSPSASATTYSASDLWEERVSSQLWAARSMTVLPAAGPSTALPAWLSTTGARIALPQTSHAKTLTRPADAARSQPHCGP